MQSIYLQILDSPINIPAETNYPRLATDYLSLSKIATLNFNGL